MFGRLVPLDPPFVEVSSMRFASLIPTWLILSAIAVGSASAQEGYAIGENAATANSGPVRLARVSYLAGPVSWRPNDSTEWSSSSMNMPLRQGAQIWVKSGSRGELIFDDGSTVRLGAGAIATMQTMYSDDHGEFTEIKLNDGLATFHLRNKNSEFQIDTPQSSVKANGPAMIRVGVGDSTEYALSAGTASVSGQQGETLMHPRERLKVRDRVTPYEVTPAPDPDQWDRFNDNRDVIYSHRNEHVPANIDLVSGDLDNYGTWHNDPSNGYVWAPRNQGNGWRPYHNGRWVWVSPWGWTWVGNEDWGYAPYHYGTWMHASYGWAWSPGPRVQYWSPGVVAYVDNGSSIGWAPLGPREVHYPAAINIGFSSGDWSLNFSIGGAAAYYPAGGDYCEARPWNNTYANREVNVYNTTNITNIYNGAGQGSNSVFVRNSRFIPQNGSRYAGMTMASNNAFLAGRGYQNAGIDPRGTVFRNGRSFNGAPTNSQVFGPPRMRPGAASFTASRAFNRAGAPPQNLMQRSIVRRGLPAAVMSHSSPMRGSFAPSNRQATVQRNASRAITPQTRTGANVQRGNPMGRVQPGLMGQQRGNSAGRNTNQANRGNPTQGGGNRRTPVTTRGTQTRGTGQSQAQIANNANTRRQQNVRAAQQRVTTQRQAQQRQAPQRQAQQRQAPQRQAQQRQAPQRQAQQRQAPPRQNNQRGGGGNDKKKGGGG